MRRATFAAACLAALLGAASQDASASADRAAASLDFDKAFSTKYEPKRGHFVATYVVNGSEHRLEVWRDGEGRLRRRTDDRVETYVSKPAGEVEWKMTVLDLKRRIRTDVDRTNLMRVGHFSDWFGLAHGVARPIGVYAVNPLRQPPPGAAPIAACRWYVLSQHERSSKICWSASQALPLLITDGEDRVQWRVTAVDSARHLHETFDIDDRGFVRNDANEDIKAD
ncbi:MAG: hypothetical protein ABI460_03050 [Caldimonas sp.]